MASFSTSMSIHWIPFRSPHPIALRKASLAAKRMAKHSEGRDPLEAPSDFLFGKDATKEKVSPTVHGSLDPFHVHQIDSRSDNHKGSRVRGFKGSRDHWDPGSPNPFHRIRAIISRTARSRPTKIARAMMLWPILNSSISLISAIRLTLP